MRDEIVENSAIARIKHDGTTLRVFFKAGTVYDVPDVSDELVNNLVKADNPGRYFVRSIMPDRDRVMVDADRPFPPNVWD